MFTEIMREGSNLHFARPKLPLKHSNRFALFHLLCCNQSDCPAIVGSVGVTPLSFSLARSLYDDKTPGMEVHPENAKTGPVDV